MSGEFLDDHLRHHYGSQKIDPIILSRLGRLANLEKAGDGSTVSGGRRTPRRRILSRIAMAAASVAALVLFSLILPDLWQAGSEGSDVLSGSILREVALNHRKNLAIEFSGIGYPRLREQMVDLDFSLRPPRRQFMLGELRMLGGRYCSIQGRMAAQIKLEDQYGRVLTLYQTSFGEHFEGLPELQRELDGIQIRVWREDDLLFALAGTEI